MSTTLPAPLSSLPPIFCESPGPGHPHTGTQPDHGHSGSARQVISDSKLKTTAAALITTVSAQPAAGSNVPPDDININAVSDSDSDANAGSARQVISDDSKLKTTAAHAPLIINSDADSISDADPNPNADTDTDTDTEPLSETMRRLELASAKIHNFRLAARNARNIHGKLELLEKTIPGTGIALAHALTRPNTSLGIPHDAPTPTPTKIRDRPKGFAHISHIDEFTEQDILDLVVFYNDDFGIVVQDDEVVRRGKLLGFLTGCGGERV